METVKRCTYDIHVFSWFIFLNCVSSVSIYVSNFVFWLYLHIYCLFSSWYCLGSCVICMWYLLHDSKLSCFFKLHNGLYSLAIFIFILKIRQRNIQEAATDRKGPPSVSKTVHRVYISTCTFITDIKPCFK